MLTGIRPRTGRRPHFHEFGLKSSYLDASQQVNRLSNITSMVHIRSILGALIALFLCEHIGMLWSMRQLCLLWLIGVVIFITASGRIGQKYAGRDIMGLGIGHAGVIAPTYLAEIAPAHARGMFVSLFGMSEYIGIMVGVSQRAPWKRVIVVLIAAVLLGLGSCAAYS